MSTVAVDFILLPDDELARLHAALSTLDNVLAPALDRNRLPRNQWQLLGDIIYAEMMQTGLALEARGLEALEASL